MEQIIEILKLLVIATLAIGYLVKILKGKKADSILSSLINVIDRFGTTNLKTQIATTMVRTELNNAVALDKVVQKVTKGKKASKIWKVIKFVIPFVL